MKKLFVGLLFMFAFTIRMLAQTQEPASTPITINGPIDIGPASFMHPNIYSIPLTIGNNSGTMWFYPQYNGGFITFRSPLEGSTNVMALVTSWTANSYNSVGQVTSATATYTVQGDPNGDGDTDVVMGSITLNFSYYYKVCGRYCTGWHEIITSGSGAQSITQN